eukprot:7267167-Prymnesium_polylepis.1
MGAYGMDAAVSTAPSSQQRRLRPRGQCLPCRRAARRLSPRASCRRSRRTRCRRPAARSAAASAPPPSRHRCG